MESSPEFRFIVSSTLTFYILIDEGWKLYPFPAVVLQHNIEVGGGGNCSNTRIVLLITIIRGRYNPFIYIIFKFDLKSLKNSS